MKIQIVVLKELVAGLDESIIECERIGVIEIESVVPGVFGAFQALLANHAEVNVSNWLQSELRKIEHG